MLSCTNCLALLTTASLIAGCGGLDLRQGTVSAGKAGYQLYYPKILVTVSAERQCIKPEAGGACPGANWEYNCVMSKPWVLPDYSKPYVATFKPGLGSQSASIEIVDGWMLGQASSATDVSAIAATLLELAAEDANKNCNAGIYEWTVNGFQRIDPPKI